MSAAREKFALFFARKDGLTYKASTKDVLQTLFGQARVREDTLNIPVAYYTCGSKAFFPIRKFHAKHFRSYEANFVDR